MTTETTSGYALKRIDEMEAIYAGTFKRARAELGVSSFGMQVLDLPPGIDAYPEHDHAADGQEEVFIPMSGSCEIELDGEVQRLEPGTMIRVGPAVSRKVVTRDDPIRLLILGATPGAVYEAPQSTQLGEPDPMAGPAQTGGR